MDTLGTILKSEIDELISILSQNKDPKSIFNSVNSTISDIPTERANPFLEKLKEYYDSTKKTATDKEASGRAYMCASAYAIQSQRELESGNQASALRRINKANYFLGRSLEAMRHSDSSVFAAPITDTMTQALKNHGKDGGKARDNKREPLRQEAARLLSELKPKDGWNTYQKAATDIAKHVGKFIEQYELNHPGTDLEIGTSEDTLVPTIIRWITKVDVVTKAFESNASQKALNRIKNKKLKKHEDAPLPPSDEP